MIQPPTQKSIPEEKKRPVNDLWHKCLENAVKRIYNQSQVASAIGRNNHMDRHYNDR
jgi:hypothetical protein